MKFDYFFSDPHLGEDRLDIMGRPWKNTEEHDASIQLFYNTKVKPDNHVLWLGDVTNFRAPHALKKVAKFNGTKTLIRGNHDRCHSDEELLKYFDVVIPEGEGLEFTINDELDCWASHYPHCGREDRFNLCGHVHGMFKVLPNMLNCSVDAHHFDPISADKVLFYFKGILDFYDVDAFAAYLPCNMKWKNERGLKETRMDDIRGVPINEFLGE